MRTLFAALLVAMLAHGPAQAQGAQCQTRIDGEDVTIFYSADEVSYSSLRERFSLRRQDCPGAVVITYLMPDLTAEERQIFCANHDPDTRSHSQPAHGRRDAYGRCVEPSRTCQLVNTTREETMALMGMAEPGSAGSRLSSLVSRVTHSSGALILSGNASSLSGLLGSVGTVAGAVASSPALLAGAAASVVVIGGAVYVCAD
ncbi:MAG: hypothetical protein JJU09_13055 [Rhodobacteraceae bacterium]|nr:hypothetical protein [Paracoccaceae bacterium]TVR44117.1 MAG: hypothetical protein EA386_14825 [Paracoccaceae bacterium]